MIDKFSLALALMREAFADAQTGSGSLACVDLAAEVDGAQQVINAASAVQTLRVAQYAAREDQQDGSGAWTPGGPRSSPPSWVRPAGRAARRWRT